MSRFACILVGLLLSACGPRSRPDPDPCPKRPDRGILEFRAPADEPLHREAQASGWGKIPPGWIAVPNPFYNTSTRVFERSDWEQLLMEDLPFITACDLQTVHHEADSGARGRKIALEFYRDSSARMGTVTERLSSPGGPIAVLVDGRIVV